MHFNTKYINLGDSEKEIKDKINYNFNQILSFAVGHEGLPGPKGANGIPGPSGKIGLSGSTGDRASEWYRGITFPSSPQEFDLWINDSSELGDVYERGATSWGYTGLSLFKSDFFEVYSGIIGPLGLTNKSAIGIKSTYTPNQTSLVISDSYFSSLDVNPNNSKVLIATEDQTTNPIFSFNKSNGNSLEYPSFYWKNLGTSSDLIFKSPGGLSIFSLREAEISSNDLFLGGGVLISGDSFHSSVTVGNINLIGGGSQMRLFTDPLVNSVIIDSSYFKINTNEIFSANRFEISSNNSVPGSYVLSSVPIGSPTDKYFGGISVKASSLRIFDFGGTGGSILYGRPLNSVTSGDHKQVVFGETGGVPAGATSGPYSYHVKGLTNSFFTPYSLNSSFFPEASKNSIFSFLPSTISNILNITSPSNWNSNLLVLTVDTSLTPMSGDAYIYIPSTTNTSLEPVFYQGEATEFRVYLNEKANFPSRKIRGIIYDYTVRYTQFFTGNVVTEVRKVFLNLPSPCSYVDLFWAWAGSATNPNGRIFWKTCDGSSGILDMTNIYTVSSNPFP